MEKLQGGARCAGGLLRTLSGNGCCEKIDSIKDGTVLELFNYV